MKNITCALMLLVGCTGAPAATAVVAEPEPVPEQSNEVEPDPVEIRLGEFTEDLDQQSVVARGRYEQVDVRKKRTGEPVYHGHAVVTFADDHVVFIEPTWSKAAIRSQREIRQFEGKLVEVHGFLHHRCPGPPSGGAAIISPCLVEVTKVHDWAPDSKQTQVTE